MFRKQSPKQFKATMGIFQLIFLKQALHVFPDLKETRYQNYVLFMCHALWLSLSALKNTHNTWLTATARPFLRSWDFWLVKKKEEKLVEIIGTFPERRGPANTLRNDIAYHIICAIYIFLLVLHYYLKIMYWNIAEPQAEKCANFGRKIFAHTVMLLSHVKSYQ
jgi:hypothetical protein